MPLYCPIARNGRFETPTQGLSEPFPTLRHLQVSLRKETGFYSLLKHGVEHFPILVSQLLSLTMDTPEGKRIAKVLLSCHGWAMGTDSSTS